MAGKVRCDMSMSLDGFVAGPDGRTPPYVSDEGFFRVTSWIVDVMSWRERQGFEGGANNDDAPFVDELFDECGAYVMGRVMFDAGEVPWGEEPPFRAPVFVVTSRPREPLEREGGTTFHFVERVDEAFARAREAAGDEAVGVSGGARMVQQAIAGGHLDELHLHVAPVLLGGGVRLLENIPPNIELQQLRAVQTGTVTHLSYRVSPAQR